MGFKRVSPVHGQIIVVVVGVGAADVTTTEEIGADDGDVGSVEEEGDGASFL